MEQLLRLPPAAFAKIDPEPDTLFYQQPRFVTHIDDEAIAAVTETYRQVLRPDTTVLDLMSSWVSHLPPEISLTTVGHGMNPQELAANPRLSRWFVQDLNLNPQLPLQDASFDAACLCVSVQYLQRPVDVFRDVLRILRPGAPLTISFSNRCFPTKAIAIWQSLSGPDQQRYVAACLHQAGFTEITGSAFAPPDSDPLWVVIGRTSAS